MLRRPSKAQRYCNWTWQRQRKALTIDREIANMATKNNSKTSKPALFGLAIAASDAADFEAKAKAAGHETASFSANGPWDWYYDAVRQYVADHDDGEDHGSTYVVLNAVALYIGQSQEEYDEWAAERRETMGSGAADRLAKAREKAQAEGKRKDAIIAALMAKLGMTDEDLEALA